MKRLLGKQTPDECVERVIARVRELRNAHGYSAEDFATHCRARGLDISRNTIANIETGRRSDLTLREVLVFADVFGVSVLDLADARQLKVTVRQVCV